MSMAEDLIGSAEVVSISSIFGGAEDGDVTESEQVKDMPNSSVSKRAADLLGEAEAKALGNLFGKDKEDEEQEDEPKEEPDKSSEDKPDKPAPDKRQVASLNWVQGCIDEALDDVKEERRPELEDKVWLKLLKNKVGDGSTSDITKKGILNIVSAVLGGRSDALPDEEMAPSPVDIGSLGTSSRVVVNNESNDIFLGTVKSIRGDMVVVESDEGGTMTVPISDVTELDLDEGVMDILMKDDADVESLIDSMI